MMIKDLLKRNKIVKSVVRAWRRVDFLLVLMSKTNQQLRVYTIVFQGARETAERFAASEHVQWCIQGAFQ